MTAVNAWRPRTQTIGTFACISSLRSVRTRSNIRESSKYTPTTTTAQDPARSAWRASAMVRANTTSQPANAAE